MFADRVDAGRQLAGRLTHLKDEAPIVLGLPRGGVVVAAQVADALGAPLDVLVVRKLGAPFQPELAIGAIIDGDPPQKALNDDLIRALGVDEMYIEQESAAQLEEARRRQTAYRRGRDAVDITGRTVIVVDDGVATGATVNAALIALKQTHARRLVLAVPVAPPDTIARLRERVDELVCLSAPAAFRAVGQFYRLFDQTTDEEVIALLHAVAR
jgi:putative phosphoribosyl transferase